MRGRLAWVVATPEPTAVQCAGQPVPLVVLHDAGDTRPEARDLPVPAVGDSGEVVRQDIH